MRAPSPRTEPGRDPQPRALQKRTRLLETLVNSTRNHKQNRRSRNHEQNNRCGEKYAPVGKIRHGGPSTVCSLSQCFFDPEPGWPEISAPPSSNRRKNMTNNRKLPTLPASAPAPTALLPAPAGSHPRWCDSTAAGCSCRPRSAGRAWPSPALPGWAGRLPTRSSASEIRRRRDLA